MPIDDRTPNLNLALPNVDNLLEEDVARLRSALTALDSAVAGRALPSDITAAINALLDGAPSALNTLNELAAALGDDASYAASITAALAAKLESVPIATPTVVGGVKVGTSLSITAGVLDVAGGLGSQAFSDTYITPTAGQTTLTISGGYVAGQIELFANGSLYYGGGDDYTATNGTTITLTVAASGTETLLLRKWQSFASVVVGPTAMATDTHAATSKTTPVDADEIGIADSAAAFGWKKLTWGNLKATLGSLYQAILISGTNIKTVGGSSVLGSGDIAVQSSLVSGTNIKTVGGISLLGSGDITTGLTRFLIVPTTQAAIAGTDYWATNVAATTLTAPTAADGAKFAFTPANGLLTNTINFGAATVIGPAGTVTGILTLDLGLRMEFEYSTTLGKWVSK